MASSHFTIAYGQLDEYFVALPLPAFEEMLEDPDSAPSPITSDPLDEESEELVYLPTAMLDELDDDMWDALGDLCTFHNSIGSAPWVEIAWANQKAAIQQLKEAGYEVTRRQDLVDLFRA
jgi:hypothetical protein